MSGEGWRDTRGQEEEEGEGGEAERASESFESLFFGFFIFFFFWTCAAFLLADARFNLKWMTDKRLKTSYVCNPPHLTSFFPRFLLFVIYLKIEQAHSGFHKGDQSNGFCQWASFQAALKPVNKLNTQGGFRGVGVLKSHARLINGPAAPVDAKQKNLRNDYSQWARSLCSSSRRSLQMALFVLGHIPSPRQVLLFFYLYKKVAKKYLKKYIFTHFLYARRPKRIF